MAVRASREKRTGNSGERAVSSAFDAIGWGVADNVRDDLGTDLIVMARDQQGSDLGLFVGVQVKTSRSELPRAVRDPAGDLVGWWFRDRDRDHVDAWIAHALPHLLVLHDLRAHISYWVHVTADAVISTGKGVRILVRAANTVDAAHQKDLLKVAASIRPPMAWEGTAWTGVASLPPRALLRHALVVPRLIAPHPNLRHSTAPTPAQMTALLVQARLSDAARFAAEHAEVPLFEEAASSPTWGWRFAGALAHRLTTGDTGGLPELVDTAPDAMSRAAAAVTATAGLLDDDRADEALTLLEAVLAREDAEPVDHAWLQIQHARVCAETGRVDDARAAALEVLTIGATHSADATATAIAGIAAELLFSTSDWGARNVADVITGVDTTAAWWRTETTSQGLSAVAERTFNRWARDTSIVWGGGDPANDRLLSASLMANHLGDHSQWRYLTGLLGRDALLRLDRDASADAARSGLALLRLAGDRQAVELAVRRLATDGPATAVTVALADIDLPRSTRTTGPTNLALLEHGGDLADAATADRSVTWLLQSLIDPVVFIHRTSPSYRVDHYLLKALAGVIPAASPGRQQQVAEHLAALVDVDDQVLATDWSRVAAALPTTAWVSDTAREAGQNANGHHEALGWTLLEVAARFDPAVHEQLIDGVRSGSPWAFVALGDPRGLSADLVEALIARLASQLTRQLTDAQGGASDKTLYDIGQTVTILNVWHPDLAVWDPLCELLADRWVSGAHKKGALRALASLVDRLPDDIRSRLVTIAAEVARAPGLADPFIGPDADATAAAAELLAALTPTGAVDPLLDLLAGNALHRQSAAGTAYRLTRPEDIGVLVSLARDPEPSVRATAAAALASLVAADRGGPLAAATLQRCVHDPGMSVALSVAAALANEVTRSPAADTVLDGLRLHPSAAVRHQVARAGSTRSSTSGRTPDSTSGSSEPVESLSPQPGGCIVGDASGSSGRK